MSVRRKPLSESLIVDSAMRLIEAEGPDALTMRRLADELGTTAMAFYNHFQGREGLVDAIVTRLYSTLALPTAKAQWDQRLMHLTDHFIRSSRRWPRNWQLAMSRTVKPALTEAIISAALEALVDAGLDPHAAEAANFSLMMMLRGMFLWNGEHCDDKPHFAAIDDLMRGGMRIFLDGVAAQCKPANKRKRQQ